METVLWAFLAVALCSVSVDSRQPERAFKCLADGYFQHSTDCTSYFRCESGVPTLRHCPAPLHFNKYNEGCDWPLSDTCSSDEYDSVPEYASPPLKDIAIPRGVYCPHNGCVCKIAHPCNCTLFYRCYFTNPLLRGCPGGLHYNAFIEECDTPENAKCVIDPECFKTTTTTTEPTTTTTPKTTTTTTPKTTTTTTPKTTTTTTTEPTTTTTTEPTTTTTTEPTTTTTTERTTTTTPSTTTEPSTTPTPPACCCNFKADRSDCEAYYVKDKNDVLIRKRCPSGLHFNRKARVCDFPHSAKCSKPVGKCDCQCCMVEDKCDCYKYYYCEDGILTHEKCADGLMFNPKIGTCDYRHHVNRNCSIRNPFTTTDPSVIVFTITDPTTPEFTTKPESICSCGTCVLPNPSDCSSYYRCLYGNLQSVRCPSSQLFNRKTKECVPKGYESCPSVVDPEFCPREQGLFPLPGKCTEFIECDRGVAYKQKCPDNTEFNPQTQLCDWPSGACGGKITTDNLCPRATGLFPHPDNCAKFFHCEHGTRFVKDCASPLHFNARLGVCDWPENAHCGEVQMYSMDNAEAECKETPGIDCPCACRIPNYDSCSDYYQCTSEGKACSKTCPVGLQFNRVTRVCDIPENAKCTL